MAGGGALAIDTAEGRDRLAQWLGVHDSPTLTSLEADSILCIPLAAHGRWRGAMILGQARGRGYNSQDRALAIDLSSRLALHIDSCLQYERAQRAIRVREDVLAIASHDLRSPLSTVLGNVELVMRMDPGVSDPVRSRLLAVQRAGVQMRRLISDLLDAAAIEAGALSLEQQTCQAEQLVREAVEMHLVTAEPRSIRLTSSVKAGFKVTCDPGRLLQVLSNLVWNAIKFTGDGGAVLVAAELVGQEARFSVSDTGFGIAADVLPRIFDRYWRAAKDRLPGEPRAGAGLGLYIANGIVEAHGGGMVVESRLGKGTKVSFTLPGAAP
jgi:signal transduction histidine kinase